MSQENVEMMRRSNAAYNRRDHDAAFADFDPNVEWRDLQHAPDAPERLVGISAVREYWDLWQDVFGEMTADIEEYIDAGDYVVVVTHWSAKGEGSGVLTDQRSADVYEFADGKVIRATIGYSDKAAALKAVGLEE